MKILSIETSCDETGVAIVDDQKIISAVTYSQIKHHKVWGGVMPSVARRAHEDRLPTVLSQTLKKAKLDPDQISKKIDAIAVTAGPGLAPSLETGIALAKHLALKHQLPLIPANHLEGHIASVFLQRSTGTPLVSSIKNINHPFLSLIVSGGHTELVVTKKDYHHTIIGQTMDDAAGEAIDKIGRELGLGYPAGPGLERLASSGDPKSYDLPIPLSNSPKENLDFSFSGIKTKALHVLHGRHDIGSFTKRESKSLVIKDKKLLQNFAASFQQAIIEALLLKVKRAVESTHTKDLVLTGGVAANQSLRDQTNSLMKSLGGRAHLTPKTFSGDNAAIIGLAAQWAHSRGEILTTDSQIQSLDRQPNLNFKIE